MIPVRTMRAVDFWVGVPLTAVLGLVHRVLKAVGPRRSLPAPRRLCLVELSEAGSTVLAYSALRRLQRRYPEAELYWLIFRAHADGVALLEVIPRERILTIRTAGLTVFVADTLRFLVTARRLRLDTVIDLELFSRFTALLTYLSGAPRRIGFHNGHGEGLFRGNFLTHKVFYNPYQHVSLNYHALVDAVAEPEPVPVPAVRHPLSAADVEVCRRSLTPARRERGVRVLHAAFPGCDPTRQTVVLLNPSAGALPLRAWPLERYADLARRLVAHSPDVLVGVVGLPEAQPEADAITAAVRSPQCASLVGCTADLVELVDLLHVCHVLVSNDGGPAHFATLTDIRVVVLFGPETPTLYGPPGGDRVTCLYAGLACSPCYTAANHRSSPCADNRCLQAIPVEAVWSRLEAYLPAAATGAAGGPAPAATPKPQGDP